MANKQETRGENVWAALQLELKNELERCRQDLKDTGPKVEQCQAEVNKLAKQNATASSQLQQYQSLSDHPQLADLKAAYEATLSTQQRLFLMRGQLDKIQSDLTHLKEYEAILVRVLGVIDTEMTALNRHAGSAATVETVEMIIQAQEAERQRLSRQMHDGPAQALSNFILQTEIAMRLFDTNQEKAREELSALKASATTSFQQIREFIFALRPMMLDDLGLGPTVKKYVEAFEAHPGVEIDLTIPGIDRRLESYVEVLVFRAIQELLGNALRHSQASKIKVVLDMSDTLVKVQVDDNGRGFELAVLEERNNRGIKIIRERVEMLGGEFEIKSMIGQGTHVAFQVPATIIPNIT
ncbi:MAG: histidine kinase [Anaerolineales bacterium]|nr:histidine kinase [Anaerolineales bacterium]